jgi:hypothetical protein
MIVRQLIASIGRPVAPLPRWLEGGIVAPDDVDPLVALQKWWTNHIYKRDEHLLMQDAVARDRARLQCQVKPSTGAWMCPIPSAALGYAMSGPEFRCAAKWWLGIPLLDVSAAGTPCSLCSAPVDVYGDHTVSCPLNGTFRRHQAVQLAFQSVMRAHGVSCHLEVVAAKLCPEDASYGRMRPADVLLPTFDSAGPLAIDFTVVHGCSRASHWPMLTRLWQLLSRPRSRSTPRCVIPRASHLSPWA